MAIIAINIVSSLANLIILLVIVDSVLSFFLNPYHPVRNGLDRILQPFLTPIRKVVPLVGMFDLSPLILIIVVQIISFAMISFLSRL
jgi:YggT family protein